MRHSTKLAIRRIAIFFPIVAMILMAGVVAVGQTPADDSDKLTAPISSETIPASDIIGKTTTLEVPPPTSPGPARAEFSGESARSLAPQGGEPEWQFEIRPYLWLAGINGILRIDNLSAGVGQDSSEVLGMLDFAAAAQVEAIHGRWRIMLDENYVNLGTTGTGPLGLVQFEVEPTLNIFEFGGSYTFVTIPNKKATAAEPLPPVFTLEALAGGRYFHMGLEITPTNFPPVEGSRNLVGFFAGNRFRVGLHPAITLIGKYTVGTSGAGSNFAWSADGLLDLRWKPGFSIAGGYRILDMNADQPSNRVGFDGRLKGILLAFTLYR